MINKVLELVFGKAMLQTISKRLVAFFISLIAGVSPMIAEAGFKIDIDDTKFGEWLVFILGTAVTYIIAETKKPSSKK